MFYSKWTQDQKFGAIVLVAAVIVALAVALWPVSKPETVSAPARVDVVGGVSPVSRDMEADIITVQNALARMPAGQREAWLRAHYPHLAEGVEYYLRQNGYVASLSHIDRIGFHYGSLGNVRAQTGTGVDVTGYFRDKIIAVVYVHGEPLPRAYALQCLNGLTSLPPNYRAQLQQLGPDVTPIHVFTIEHGRGLAYYVGYQVAVATAEYFRLPMYRGKVQNAQHHITYAVARSLQSETDRVQVTVKVHEGDHFDLETMTFTPAPLRHHRHR